jgi:hypothetical protein
MIPQFPRGRTRRVRRPSTPWMRNGVRRRRSASSEARSANQRCTGCVADGVVALPLLMTRERSGTSESEPVSTVDPAGGERVRGLDVASDVRVTAARPDGRLRHWRCRMTGAYHVRANVDTSRTSSQSHRPTPSPWDNGWYIGLGRERAAKWPLAGHVNGCLETTGVMWGYVPLTRHFSPTASSAYCP